MLVLYCNSGGEVHKYSPRSIHAHSDDVLRTLLDGNVDTCLQFLGGTGGTAPWYTHLTIPLPHNGSFHSNVTGHNLGCGESLTLVIWSDDQGNQRGKRTKCRLDHVYGENGVEICTQMCSCPDGSCDKLDIIHRPMSSQPSSWKLCDIMEGMVSVIINIIKLLIHINGVSFTLYSSNILNFLSASQYQ